MEIIFTLLGAFVVLFLLIVVYAHYFVQPAKDAARSQELKEFASKMGWDFAETPSLELRNELQLSKWTLKRNRNFVKGTHAGVEFLLFDEIDTQNRDAKDLMAENTNTTLAVKLPRTYPKFKISYKLHQTLYKLNVGMGNLVKLDSLTDFSKRYYIEAKSSEHENVVREIKGDKLQVLVNIREEFIVSSDSRYLYLNFFDFPFVPRMELENFVHKSVEVAKPFMH